MSKNIIYSDWNKKAIINFSVTKKKYKITYPCLWFFVFSLLSKFFLR